VTKRELAARNRHLLCLVIQMVSALALLGCNNASKPGPEEPKGVSQAPPALSLEEKAQLRNITDKVAGGKEVLPSDIEVLLKFFHFGDYVEQTKASLGLAGAHQAGSIETSKFADLLAEAAIEAEPSMVVQYGQTFLVGHGMLLHRRGQLFDEWRSLRVQLPETDSFSPREFAFLELAFASLLFAESKDGGLLVMSKRVLTDRDAAHARKELARMSKQASPQERGFWEFVQRVREERQAHWSR
jgi:hypothetical protein